MKKISLVIVLLTAIHFNTKAQKLLSTDASCKAAFTNAFNYSNKVTAATTDYYMPEDSASLVKNHAYYVLKSKNYRTTGLILLGSGFLLSGLGLLIAASRNSSFDNAQTGATIMGVGALSGIVSIPMMVIARVYRNKANFALSSQKTGFGIPASNGDITGLTLSIPIGK